jgi:hypothetical protein
MLTNIFSSFCLFLFIFLLSIPSTLTLLCYQCNNCTDLSCKCDTVVSNHTQNFYCILLRESSPFGYNIEIKLSPRNATKYYIYDPYYISVEETISYDDRSERWFSNSRKMTYACQTDNCNRADLLKQLPHNGLSLMLPHDWLNENLLRKPDKNMTICYQCPDEAICSDTTHVNMSKCNEKKDCQGSCIMTETYEQAETTQFCYQSFCSDESSIGPEMMTPEISITAVYYINKNQFEVVELDVKCNGDDCSRLEIFQDIKSKLEKDLNGIQPFLPRNHVNSLSSTSIIFLIMLVLQIMIFN